MEILQTQLCKLKFLVTKDQNCIKHDQIKLSYISTYHGKTTKFHANLTKALGGIADLWFRMDRWMHRDGLRSAL